MGQERAWVKQEDDFWEWEEGRGVKLRGYLLSQALWRYRVSLREAWISQEGLRSGLEPTSTYSVVGGIALSHLEGR